MRKRVRDRRAEARPYKGMSQTKVKSRMYASKLLTERSPVAKCVMIAEASTDAPKSFCDAPDGTGHRDMARSDSSARELGRSAAAKAGAEVGGDRSSEEAGNDRGYPPSEASLRSRAGVRRVPTLRAPRTGRRVPIRFAGSAWRGSSTGRASGTTDLSSRTRTTAK